MFSFTFILPLQTVLNKNNIRDINTSDDYGKTLILHAAESNDPKLMNILLKQKNIKVNARDKDGIAPLHTASENGYTECVKLLLAHEQK